MFKLKDGRKELYQWDVGVVADVTDANINEVHFSNLRYGVSFIVKVQNGTVTIPPEVLQSGADVLCWAFVRQKSGGYTKKEQIVNVEKRPRPADYIYEPTKVLTWEELKQDIAELEKGTIPTMDNVNVWELEAGVYYVNNTVFYATPHPPVYLNCVEMQSQKGLLYVHIDISNNNSRDFYLFANGNIYFGNSMPNAIDGVEAAGSISSIAALIKNEITTGSVNGIPTKNAVYNFGENIKTELLADIGDKADKTEVETALSRKVNKSDVLSNIDKNAKPEDIYNAPTINTELAKLEKGTLKEITSPCHIAELEKGIYVIKNNLVGGYSGQVTFSNVTVDKTIDDSYFTLTGGLLVVHENIKKTEADGTETSIIGFTAQGSISVPNKSYSGDVQGSPIEIETAENAISIQCYMLESTKFAESTAPYEANKWYSTMPDLVRSDIPASAIKNEITTESTIYDIPSALAVKNYVNESFNKLQGNLNEVSALVGGA